MRMASFQKDGTELMNVIRCVSIHWPSAATSVMPGPHHQKQGSAGGQRGQAVADETVTEMHRQHAQAARQRSRAHMGNVEGDARMKAAQ